MGKLQQELLAEARSVTEKYLLTHPVFAAKQAELTVLLSGSGTASYADRYSGIDLIVLCPHETSAALKASLAETGIRGGSDGFALWNVPMENGTKLRVMVNVHSLEDATEELAVYDDFAMLAYTNAPVVFDPKGQYDQLLANFSGEYPAEVLTQRIQSRYQGLRRRRASITWNLRRGQPFVLLQNLVALLDHALNICFYLAGQPPVGRKWLFQEGLRTPTGRRLRPIMFELLSNLGDVALLGGTLNIRQNRLYGLVSQLQEELERAIAAAGYEEALGGAQPPADRDDDGADRGADETILEAVEALEGLP